MDDEVKTPRLDREFEIARQQKAACLEELTNLRPWARESVARHNMKLYLVRLLSLFAAEAIIGGVLFWLQWTLVFLLFQYGVVVFLVHVFRSTPSLTVKESTATDEQLLKLVEDSPTGFDILKRWYAEDRILWTREVKTLERYVDSEIRMAIVAGRRESIRELLADDGLDDGDEDEDVEQLISAYVRGQMDGQALTDFELRMFDDPELADAVEAHFALSKGLKEYVIHQYLEGTLAPEFRSEVEEKAKVDPMLGRYLQRSNEVNNPEEQT